MNNNNNNGSVDCASAFYDNLDKNQEKQPYPHKNVILFWNTQSQKDQTIPHEKVAKLGLKPQLVRQDSYS